MPKGKLYIVPIPIAEDSLDKVLPSFNHSIVKPLRFFVVEKLKTARQFLRKMDREFPIDDSEFFEMNKHDDYQVRQEVFQALEQGNDVGLISESGYPAVADPGTNLVLQCHKKGVQVIPLVGPSSILLALAASGLNGQGFSFNGYIPQKNPDRIKQLKFFEGLVKKTGNAQIFIETPYRNQQFFDDVLSQLDPQLNLCVAFDITGEREQVKTMSINDWKKNPFKFDKTPCVFVIG